MAGVLAWRAAGGDRRAGLGARGVRGEGGGERWGADAARGEVRMRGVLVRGEPQGSPFFVRVLRGDWRWLGSRGSVFQTGLPLWTGYRGSEDPRLLRDRPTDGAAWTAKIYAGFMG